MTDPHTETFRASVRASFPRHEDGAMAGYEAFEGDDRYVVAFWIALWLTVPGDRAACVKLIRQRVEAAYPDPRHPRAIEGLDALDRLTRP